jgi:hypothetical protein
LGKASCYGCVSGGPEVAADICKIMGVKAPEQAIPRFNPGTESSVEIRGNVGHWKNDGMGYRSRAFYKTRQSPGSWQSFGPRSTWAIKQTHRSPLNNCSGNIIIINLILLKDNM